MNKPIPTEYIKEIVSAYRNYKEIHNDLVEVVKSTPLLNNPTLYRGDCIYNSFLKIGLPITFHNHITSWTSNYKIAERFSNIQCIPEWYFMEDEWARDYPYPFKGLSLDDLEPVVFEISSNELYGLQTSEFVDVKNETSYVSEDEEEFIIGNTTFIITSIIQCKTYLKVELKLQNSNNLKELKW